MIPGGYVGVDVFFVISGYLITSHLLREYAADETIRLGAFYARRARRLLPAAFVVLAVALIATAIWMPDSVKLQSFREIIASTLYVENWVLAADSVDYLAAGNTPSLVQHYWSLSVEEQFYLLWPVLLLAIGWLGRRREAAGRRRFIAVGFVLIFVASVVVSVLWTAQSQSTAYFATPTRVWEFALGGLVALASGVAARWERPTALHLRTVVLTVGIAMVVAACFLFGETTDFPGAAALIPAGGTALVVLAADPATRWSLMRAGRIRPIQYTGRISYSLYLWHWPLIILFPIIAGRSAGWIISIGLGVAAFALAAATKRWVEDPFLSKRMRHSRPVFSLVAAASAMVVLTAGAGVQSSTLQVRVSAAAEESLAAASNDPCFGAAAISMPMACADVTDLSTIDTAFAAHDYADTSLGDCGEGEMKGTVGDSPECSFGDPFSATTVAVVGDSHAGHWLPAVQAIALDRGWRIISLVRSSCPFTSADIINGGADDPECAHWKAATIDRLQEIQPDLTLVASLGPYGYEAAGFGTRALPDQISGFRDTIEQLTGHGLAVAAIRDTPYMQANIPNCVDEHRDDVRPCDQPRAAALDEHDDPLWSAAEEMDLPRLDITDVLCQVDCLATIGGVVVYRDRHHFSATFARSLAPLFAARLDELGLPVR